MNAIGLPLQALSLAAGIVGGWEFLAFVDGRWGLGRWRSWIEAAVPAVWVGALVLLRVLTVSPTVVATVALSLVCFLPPYSAAVPALVLAGVLGWLNPWHDPSATLGMMVAGVGAALALGVVRLPQVWAFLVPLLWAITTALMGINGDGWLDALAWMATAPPLWVYVNERQRRTLVLSQAQFEAEHDPLTGLGNRRLLTRSLDAHAGTVGAALALDLDEFKLVNDTFGHSAGDTILVNVADRVRQTLRVQDLPIRTGGDEFLCWAPGVAGEAARRWADGICQSVTGKPVRVGEQALWVRLSCGLAEGPLSAALIERADQALLSAKRQGKNRMVVGSALPHGARGGGRWGWLSGTASTVLAHSRLGFALLDERRRVVATNAAYAEMAGYSGETLQGNALPEFHGDDQSRAGADRAPQEYGTAWYRRPDGTAWAAEQWVSEVYVGGSLAGYALLARRIGQAINGVAQRRAVPSPTTGRTAGYAPAPVARRRIPLARNPQRRGAAP